MSYPASHKSHPTFQEEEQLWQKGYQYIAGIDEVGRGSFAGPLVASAVILPPEMPYQHLINDSKMLEAPLREKLAAIIKLYAISYRIIEIPVEYINEYGVGKAAQHAFTLCVQGLHKKPDYILIDAFQIKKIKPVIQKPIIHGDMLSLSIAAASVLAKVYRDGLMKDFHTLYPKYNFTQNKGYGTLEHRSAIKEIGLCPIHRTSFNLEKFQ